MQSISTGTHYAASLLATNMFGMKKENHYKRNIGSCIRISAKNPVSVGLVGQMNSDVFNAQSQFTGGSSSRIYKATDHNRELQPF